MAHPRLRAFLVGFALLGLPARGHALALDFEGLAPFSDPALLDLPGVHLSSALVVDEETLGVLVGFSIPEDVAPGSIASSGDQGIVNFDASVLLVRFDDLPTSVSLHLVLLRGTDVSVAVFGDAGLLFQIDDTPAPGASGFPTFDLPLAAVGIREVRISAGDEPMSFFLDDLVAVPEPASAASLALGLAGFAAVRRRAVRRRPR